MFGLKRSLSPVKTSPPRTPEREALAQAIAAVAPAKAKLVKASAEVERQQARLDAVERASNRHQSAEAAVRRHMREQNDITIGRGHAAELVRLHAEIEAAKVSLAAVLRDAIGADLALERAIVAEQEARNRLSQTEETVKAAVDAVLYAEHVKQAIEQFERASKEANEARLVLHAAGFASWPRWGGGRFRSGAIFTAITEAINRQTVPLPSFEILAGDSLHGGQFVTQIRGDANRIQQLAARLTTDPDAQ